MYIVGHIFGVLLVLNFIAIGIGWIFQIYYGIKCRNKKQCQNEDCPVRDYCDKKAMGPREKKKLQDMIKKYAEKYGHDIPDFD